MLNVVIGFAILFLCWWGVVLQKRRAERKAREALIAAVRQRTNDERSLRESLKPVPSVAKHRLGEEIVWHETQIITQPTIRNTQRNEEFTF